MDLNIQGPLTLAKFDVKNHDWRQDRVGIVDTKNKRIIDITGLTSDKEKITDLQQIFNWTDRVAKLKTVLRNNHFDQKDEKAQPYDGPGASNDSYSTENRTLNFDQVEFKSPIPDEMEVWAAGVTYDKSRIQRNAETTAVKQGGFRNTDGDTVYDAVYKAERPELFFKALGKNVVPHGGTVGIREDEKESVPEPEFTLVLNKDHKLVGYTIGNDMSAREIEGENPIYLPQAKMYEGSCSVGPFVALADETTDEKAVRDWKVSLDVVRDGKSIDFKELGIEPETLVGNIKRSFSDLTSYLTRCRNLKDGAALLTGTGIIPPKGKFKLQNNDLVKITIDGLGTLVNKVKTIPLELSREAAADMANERIENASMAAIAS